MKIKQRVVYLDNVRAIAIFMVVGIHAFSYINLDGIARDVVEKFLVTIAVPIFFLVDGFIFSFQRKEGKPFNYKNYLFKSAYRLLIPWFLFSCLFLVLRYFLEYFGLSDINIVYDAKFSDVILLFYSSGISSQMYFLLSLFIIRALSLVIVNLVSMSVLVMMLVCFTYITFYHVLNISSFFYYPLDPLLHAFWGLQFYLVGILLVKSKDGKDMFYLSLIFLSLILGGCFIFGNYSLVKQLAYLLFVFNVSKWALNNTSFITLIGAHTMGIYVLHMPLVMYAVLYFSKQFVGNIYFQYLIVWVATFFIAFYISIILNKNIVGSIAFGNLEVAKRTG